MSSLDLRQPNDEQVLAIEHSGGVLLSAGAGSGKTFVLVEHIIYLFNEFCRKNSELDDISFSKELKNYFSEIVLMTFTKKAAGELFLRMKKRFAQGLERAENDLEEQPVWKWREAQLALPYLYIGTIHGFCYRLISQGYIKGFTGEEDMISDLEFQSKIDSLVEGWLESNFDDLNHNGYEHFILNKKSLKRNFKEVFSDTDIRISWSQFDENALSKEEGDEWIAKTLNLLIGKEWQSFSIDPRLYTPDAKKVPQWYLFLERAAEATTNNSNAFGFLCSLKTLFESVSRFPSVKKDKIGEEVYDFFQSLKQIRDFIKVNFDHLEKFDQSIETYKNWAKKNIEIYSYIESNYFSIPGLTFTDLEFYVWKSLVENSDSVEKVSDNYKYFIIDEFQDTSFVQFEIIRQIVKEDMGKLFSVGDVKQAIYGFRGGELGVFAEASDKTYQNLSLKKNYRSAKRVIDFNNYLFEFLLPLGKDYAGGDPYTVPMVHQEFPSVKDNLGVLEKVCVEIHGGVEEKKSLLATELNFIESEKIASYISKNDTEEIAVLYRKLAPTRFLISKLIEKNIGFTCQVKINLDEDPFLSLFVEFARACSFYHREEVRENTITSLNFIVEKLGGRPGNDYSSFFEREKSLGLMESFKQFLWEINLSSSNLSHTFPLISVLKDLSKDRAIVLFEYVQSFLRGNYSIDFQHGENPSRVKIMTVHASKGLEFETVILGGVHTNGVSKSGGSNFGKLPSSFRWFSGVGKTEAFRSPALIYEGEVEKLKDFSEFKRLFYVATTRAVEKLLWFDISFRDNPASFSKSSWINGIRKFENELLPTVTHLSESLREGMREIEGSYEDSIPGEGNLSLSKPMFHQDNLGIHFNKKEADVSLLGLGAELSVTRLSLLSLCPRKFFLKNVLKMDIDAERIFESKNDSILEENFSQENLEPGPSESVFHYSSSANRGSAVHALLEHAVKHNFVLPLEVDVDKKAVEGIDWVIEKLKEFPESYKFESEEPLKFDFFGQMISGIPDLFITNADGDCVEIWDYKTGSYNEEKATPYWFQLKAYGYALLKNSNSEKVKLRLVFLDQKEEYLKEFSLTELESNLFETWQKLSMLDQTNQEHCKNCEYSSVCQL